MHRAHKKCSVNPVELNVTYNDICRKVASESLKITVNEVFILGKLILILNESDL